jgi:hypothetical protein
MGAHGAELLGEVNTVGEHLPALLPPRPAGIIVGQPEQFG